MRRFLGVTLSLVSLMVVSRPARANTDQITLLGGGDVTFTGDGPSDPTDLTVNLGTCASGPDGCVLTGLGIGTGSLSAPLEPWTITSTENTLTLEQSSTPDLWLLSATAPVMFVYGFPSAILLEGDIHFVSVAQVPNTSTATFDHNSNTVQPTGGSLASQFGPAGAIIDWTVGFTDSSGVPLATDLRSLLGTTDSLSAAFSSGEILPTPEPGSLLLIGSGMVIAGGVLRWRRRRAKAKA